MIRSHRTALVPVLAGRPPVVAIDGWAVFLSVHDHWHLARRAQLKQRVRDAHPDHGGSRYRFMHARAEWRGFVMTEWIYYRAHGIVPPSRLPARVSSAGVLALRDHEADVLAAVRATPGIRANDLCAQFRLSTSVLRNRLAWLVKRGDLRLEIERYGAKRKTRMRVWPGAQAA